MRSVPVQQGRTSSAFGSGRWVSSLYIRNRIQNTASDKMPLIPTQPNGVYCCAYYIPVSLWYSPRVLIFQSLDTFSNETEIRKFSVTRAIVEPAPRATGQRLEMYPNPPFGNHINPKDLSYTSTGLTALTYQEHYRHRNTNIQGELAKCIHFNQAKLARLYPRNRYQEDIFRLAHCAIRLRSFGDDVKFITISRN